ncbi:MAG TPA: hypothetical protein VFK20_03675, partial [Vicinamibacterales bacterium]|nr:hypothetical protein [Vicinamibacterales bacterium]
MSALPPDGSSSVSSSGFTDGLGTRLLVFDRETGEMLEQLRLRPELSAFERALNDALARATAVEDERFARPRRIERDAEGGLSVVSEFVPGRRLSEALDSAADAGIAAGLDAALGLLLELLPAIASFHDEAGMPHGAVGAGRLLFTPAGQLVLLDGIYAASLERLQLAPARLWRDLGIAAPNADGPVHFDIAADLAQAALAAAA